MITEGNSVQGNISAPQLSESEGISDYLCAKLEDQFIVQAVFPEVVKVFKIVMQGGVDGSLNNCWTASYIVAASNDSVLWNVVRGRDGKFRVSSTMHNILSHYNLI